MDLSTPFSHIKELDFSHLEIDNEDRRKTIATKLWILGLAETKESTTTKEILFKDIDFEESEYLERYDDNLTSDGETEHQEAENRREMREKIGLHRSENAIRDKLEHLVDNNYLEKRGSGKGIPKKYIITDRGQSLINAYESSIRNFRLKLFLRLAEIRKISAVISRIEKWHESENNWTERQKDGVDRLLEIDGVDNPSQLTFEDAIPEETKHELEISQLKHKGIRILWIYSILLGQEEVKEIYEIAGEKHRIPNDEDIDASPVNGPQQEIAINLDSAIEHVLDDNPAKFLDELFDY